MISTCFRYKYGKGGGGRHPVGTVRRGREVGNPMCSVPPLSFIKIAENLLVFLSEMMGSLEWLGLYSFGGRGRQT
jgi:hypothetical protein